MYTEVLDTLWFGVGTVDRYDMHELQKCNIEYTVHGKLPCILQLSC